MPEQFGNEQNTLQEAAFLMEKAQQPQVSNLKKTATEQKERMEQTIAALLTPELREQLGFDGHVNLEDIRHKTIDDATSVLPYLVCVLALQPIKVDTGMGGEIQMLKGFEYAVPVPLYFAILANNPAAKEIIVPAKRTFKSRFRRYNGENLDGKSLLVWRYGGIGDLMFIQPLLKYFKAKYPTVKICFATAGPNLDLLKCWPNGIVDTVAAQPFQASLLDNYDYHITFEGTIERCAEAEKVNCYDVFQQVARVKFDPREFPGQLVVNPFLREKLAPFVPANTVMLQLKSTSPIRTFPLTKTRVFCSELSKYNLIAGVVERRNYAFAIQDYFIEKGISPQEAVNLAMLSPSIPHCLALLDLCDGAIAVDSAVVHLAAAIRKPVVGIYGPFPGDLRMRYYETGVWLEAEPDWNECGQRPCCFHQNEVLNCPSLPLNEPIACLNAIPIEKIVQTYLEVREKVRGLQTLHT